MNLETFEGIITINEIEYNFYYNNKFITVFPKDPTSSWNDLEGLFYRSKKEKSFETIYGKLRAGNEIIFLNVKLKPYGRKILKGFVPAYLISHSNLINAPNAENFEEIIFRGDVIDKIYSPHNLIKKSSYDFENHVPILEFNSQKDVKKTTKLNDDSIYLTVKAISSGKDKIYPILLKSELGIKFAIDKNMQEIKDYYKKITRTLSFFFNRRYLKYEEVELVRTIDVKHAIQKGDKVEYETIKEKQIYDLVINDEYKDTFDIGNIVFDTKIFLNAFPKVYNIIDENMFSLLYYSKNKYDDIAFDHYQFMSTVSAFEGQFDLVYPEYKTKKAKFAEVKNGLLTYIESQKGKENAVGKKYLSSFENMVEKWEGTLSEQLNYCLKVFNRAIEKNKQRLFVEFNILNKSNNDITTAIQNKRNSLMHTFLEQRYEPIEIVGYVLVKMLVYCLILKRAKLEEKEIISIIHSIFNQ